MNDMRIVLMNGDLGNQLYQYTFLRFLELNTGQVCLVDDSAFFMQDVEDSYQLEKAFGIKLNLLSEYFTEDVWEEMIAEKERGVSIPQQLQNYGMNLMMISDTKNYQFDGNVIYMNPQLLDKGMMNALWKAKGSIYYHGSFSNQVFYSFVKRKLQEELMFVPIVGTLEKNTVNNLYKELIYLTNSVAVYIQKENMREDKINLWVNKYAGEIELFEKRGNEYTYFIFSDDIEWCKKNKEAIGFLDIKGDYIFVEENTGDNNYIDMQLMSCCKNMIISNSSFACWAYYLNQNCKNENLIIVDCL